MASGTDACRPRPAASRASARPGAPGAVGPCIRVPARASYTRWNVTIRARRGSRKMTPFPSPHRADLPTRSGARKATDRSGAARPGRRRLPGSRDPPQGESMTGAAFQKRAAGRRVPAFRSDRAMRMLASRRRGVIRAEALPSRTTAGLSAPFRGKPIRARADRIVERASLDHRQRRLHRRPRLRSRKRATRFRVAARFSSAGCLMPSARRRRLISALRKALSMRSSPTGEPAFEGRKPELALGFDGPGASMGYGRILAAAHAAIEHEVAGSGGQTGIGAPCALRRLTLAMHRRFHSAYLAGSPCLAKGSSMLTLSPTGVSATHGTGTDDETRPADVPARAPVAGLMALAPPLSSAGARLPFSQSTARALRWVMA